MLIYVNFLKARKEVVFYTFLKDILKPTTKTCCSYDKNEDSKCIIYGNANNLYTIAMNR